MPRIENFKSIYKLPEQNRKAAIFQGLETSNLKRILKNSDQMASSEVIYKLESVPPNFLPDKAGFYSPAGMIFSENRKYDREVKDLMTRLNYKCGEYMKFDEMAKIDTALALMHYGHQGHKRKSGKPYVTHLLESSLMLADKYELDWETIASELTHDLIEDSGENGYPVSKKDLQKLLSPTVAEIVETLSKFSLAEAEPSRGYNDSVTRAELFNSLRDNPRAAICKIEERLHNMRTLKFVKNPAARRAKAVETLEYFVPLAQFIGLYDEAKILARLSLAEKYPIFTKKLIKTLGLFKRNANEHKQKYGGLSYLELVQEKISEALDIDPNNIRVLVPDIYAIYRKMGSRRNPKMSDCFVTVDLKMQQTRSEKWFKDAWKDRIDLAIKDEFVATQSLDPEQTWRDFENGKLQSLEFNMKAKFGLKSNLKINLYPRHEYDLIQIPITELYYKHTDELTDKYEAYESELLIDLIQHHDKGREKWHLIQKLLKLGPKNVEGGVFGTKLLDFVLPGNIPVNYIDHGKMTEWPIDQGSTVLDFAIDRFPVTNFEEQSWQNVRTFKVNGLPVSPNFILNSGDQIEVEFSPVTTIKPGWVRSIASSDEEYKDDIRKHFRGLLNSEVWREVADETLQAEAEEILSEKMNESLHVTLQKSEYFRNLGESGNEYLYKIALGEADGKDIEEIAKELKRYQEENLVHIKFNFNEDDTGIVEAVARVFTAKGISLRRSDGFAGIADESFPRINLVFDLNDVYADKEDFLKVRHLIDEIVEEIRTVKPILNPPAVAFPKSFFPHSADLEF